jgi:hypothetical protein
MANFIAPFDREMDGTRELQEMLEREGLILACALFSVT